MTAEAWPCKNARLLAEQVRAAGGGILRLGGGMVQVYGRGGSVIVDEPGAKDADGPARLAKITQATGLELGSGNSI